MFTWRHFVWLAICAIVIVLLVLAYKKKKPTLQQVLTSACVVCVLSELTKVFSVITLVPSADGSIIYPYIPTNHLPLHMCSIQILLIFYVRFTENRKFRETLLAFMYPTCLIGALLALAMPSIFTTSIPVERAFIHPMAYQFFVYHTMIGSLSAFIVMSKEIKWETKHYFNALKYLFLMGFGSIYINSMLASPTYVDGKLISVDFWPNFFFTYNNPLNIKMTTMTHWYIYMVIVVVLAVVLTGICFYPLIKKKKV